MTGYQKKYLIQSVILIIATIIYPPTIFIILCLMILYAIVFAIIKNIRLRVTKEVRNIQDIKSDNERYIFSGKLASNEKLLVSPITKTPCLYYHYENLRDVKLHFDRNNDPMLVGNKSLNLKLILDDGSIIGIVKDIQFYDFIRSLKHYTFSKKEYFENFTQYVKSNVDFKLIEGYYDNFSEIGDYFKNENYLEYLDSDKFQKSFLAEFVVLDKVNVTILGYFDSKENKIIYKDNFLFSKVYTHLYIYLGNLQQYKKNTNLNLLPTIIILIIIFFILYVFGYLIIEKGEGGWVIN